MGDKVKCPLGLVGSTMRAFGHLDCMKEQCAWWDEQNQCCYIRTIAVQRGH